ncbi:CDP-diacylglycerol--glycerol-3-phosphate 3-phosphatidyltransferase [Candidatus Sulfopaludibacter sp. SbA3]|nr:CDP-diacylglycerol--glycerol-3-phosphate 3-phosphatidyltransferase [Candidatus Sulfopaludibacter sp. SbA3]
MTGWINLPNILTLLRLLLVPFVIQAIVAGRPMLALALFGAASVTDILDGWAARRLRLSTQTGAYLDPIADKVLMSGVFLALAAAGSMPWWLVGIILGRDMYILLAVAVFLLLSSARKFPPSVWGKLSTFVQILTVVTCMTRNWLQISFLDPLTSAMIWICAACTIWSGLHYTWRGIQLARAH